MIEQVIKDLMENAKNIFPRYCCEHFGDNPMVVIVGEKHSEVIERRFQEKLIEKLGPKYVLIEAFKEGDEKNEWFKRWKEKYGCELITCDLSEREKRDLRRKLIGYEDQFSFEVLAGPESKQRYDDAKEMRIGEIILDYSGRSSKPLIAIIGHWHTRNDSKIHDKLKEHIDYICILDKEKVERIRKQRFKS
jgi:hypothetical protein